MTKFKKVFSLFLSLVVFSCFSASTFADNINPTEKVIPYHIEKPVVNEKNEVVGTKIIDTLIKENIVDEGTLKTITEDIKYKFTKDTQNLKKFYRDEIRTTEILIESSGDYYINGERLTDEFLNTKITLPNKPLVTPYKSDFTPYASSYPIESGGHSSLTYYTNAGTNDPTMFYLQTYLSSYTNFFLDPPSDKTYIFKHSYTGANVSDFKIYATQVANARSQINTGMAGLIAAGATVLTPAWIIGAIGTTAAAYVVYEASTAGHAAMKNAQTLLVNMKGHYVYP
ncbi:hypothetical protein YSY43_19870 [Paenibacillus sp. YSY-4.3]